jgi:hypothetical protein
LLKNAKPCRAAAVPETWPKLADMMAVGMRLPAAAAIARAMSMPVTGPPISRSAMIAATSRGSSLSAS